MVSTCMHSTCALGSSTVLIHRRAGLAQAILFDASINDGVVVLHANGRRAAEPARRVGARREPKRVVVAHAPASDLSRLDETGHRVGDLLKRGSTGTIQLHVRIILKRLAPVGLRRVPRGPVQQVHVEVVGPQPPKRALAIGDDVACVHVPAPRDLRCDHYLGAAALILFQPRANDALGVALWACEVRRDRVLLGRVDQVDAAVQDCPVHHLVAHRLVGCVEIGRAPTLRAKAHLTDDDVAAAEAFLENSVHHTNDLIGRAALALRLQRRWRSNCRAAEDVAEETTGH